MLTLMTTIKWPASLCGSATAGCWLKESLLLFLEISLIAWVVFGVLSATLQLAESYRSRQQRLSIPTTARARRWTNRDRCVNAKIHGL